jgi:amino acid transporter
VSTTESKGNEDVSGLFTRQASGLVRVAGTFDTFIFCIGFIGLGSGIFTGFFYHAFYPGSSFLLATLIAGIGSVFVALCFYLWSITFPRSGGTFVFLSRSVGPGVGFTLTFFEAIAFCFLGGVNAYFMVQVGIAPLFSMLGILTDADFASVTSWLATGTGTFVVGGAIVVITGLVPMLGMRRLLLLQRVMFALAVVGVLVGFLVLLFKTRAGFDKDFTAATGLTRAEVLAAAGDSGFNADPGFSLSETLKLTVWPAGYLAFAVMTSSIGGEIKAVRRSQFVGMVGSVIVATLAIIAFIPFAHSVFGREFMDALVWNSTEAPDASTSAPPYITLLLGIASPNAVVGAVVIVGFIAWLYFLISPQLVYAQRLMVAWSFDRIAPERLGYVSDRFRSPVVAIGISVVIGLTFLALVSYGVLSLLAYILGVFVVWGVVATIGVVFPRLRPDLYRSSALSRFRIGGVPAMPVVSALAAAFLIWQVVFYWRDPLVAGHTTATVVGHAIAFGLGAVTYVVARAWRKSQGIDLDKTFKELPIE